MNRRHAGNSNPDVVQLELFTNRFRAIAREMGEMLRKTAISTNVRERLDFSCALLDREGNLVVNAPHIPVHLGALGLCVRTLREQMEMNPGEMVVTNHPAYGGSHLPDVTLVSPVYSRRDNLLGYVANRAHHAEIGGSRPGSMPPAATKLSEEGVVIAPFVLVGANYTNWDRMRDLLSGPPHPTRSLSDNLSDLRAAVAANRLGEKSLRELAVNHGDETLAHYMTQLRRVASRRIREALSEYPGGSLEAVEHLDDGSPIRVQILIKDDEARFDFGGSSRVHPGNLNATPAIVRSAVMYVLRLLVREPLPLNEGLLDPVTIHIPDGILNPGFHDDPARSPAVVGGNVETSQRLVDTMLKALGLCAGSQGTMNNVLFGDRELAYYETVCGGCGAGATFDGADAVHSHMTNTRITDPEILEYRYPVRLERFSIRRGSGGKGFHRGGDGAVREIRFLREMDFSMLSQRRNEGAFGMNGGESGKPGFQEIVRASGERERIEAIDGGKVYAGDRLILKTPGGGGFGPPTEEEDETFE